MDLPSTQPAGRWSDQPGEHVIAKTAEQGQLKHVVLVSGRFRITPATRDRLGTEPHRALAVAVALGNATEFGVFLPFAAASLFPDDLTTAHGLVTGHFQIDAGATGAIRYPGHYTIIVSLATLIAPPVRIRIG